MSAVAPRFAPVRLRQLRHRAGLTQAGLARLAEVREQQIIRWEGGRNVPSADAVACLAAALGCEIADFFAAAGAEDDADEDRAVRLGRIADDLASRGEHRMSSELRAVIIDLQRERSR